MGKEKNSESKIHTHVKKICVVFLKNFESTCLMPGAHTKCDMHWKSWNVA